MGRGGRETLVAGLRGLGDPEFRGEWRWGGVWTGAGRRTKAGDDDVWPYTYNQVGSFISHPIPHTSKLQISYESFYHLRSTECHPHARPVRWPEEQL